MGYRAPSARCRSEIEWVGGKILDCGSSGVIPEPIMCCYSTSLFETSSKLFRLGALYPGLKRFLSISSRTRSPFFARSSFKPWHHVLGTTFSLEFYRVRLIKWEVSDHGSLTFAKCQWSLVSGLDHVAYSNYMSTREYWWKRDSQDGSKAVFPLQRLSAYEPVLYKLLPAVRGSRCAVRNSDETRFLNPLCYAQVTVRCCCLAGFLPSLRLRVKS